MKKIILRIFFIMLLIIGIYQIQTLASYVSNDPKVNSGESFSITITSTEGLENYDLSLSSYNGLTFNGCTGGSYANNGKISYASPGNTVTTLGTYTFTAPEVSEETKYNVVFDIDGVSNTSTVTVSPKEAAAPVAELEQTTTPESTQNETASSGKLNSITVNGKVYNNPLQDFTVTVENKIDKTEVSAESSDGSAVSGTGEASLKVGTNTVTLTVNGTKYYVRIRRLESLEDEKPNIIEETEKKEEEKEALALNKLTIKGYELSPKFSKDVFAYTLKIDMDKKDTDKLDITAIANDEKAKVEISGNEGLKEGENIINITVTSEDGKDTVTYQIKVNKIVSSSEVVGKTVGKTQEVVYEPIMTKEQSQIIVVITVITTILGIIFAVIEYRYTNKTEDDFEYGDNYNEPFYIKENEEGRLDVIGKEEKENIEDQNYNMYSEMLTDSEEKQAEEENGYQYEEDDYYDDYKKKKSKGKHF